MCKPIGFPGKASALTRPPSLSRACAVGKTDCRLRQTATHSAAEETVAAEKMYRPLPAQSSSGQV
jgi:hypothetical protein